MPVENRRAPYRVGFTHLSPRLAPRASRSRLALPTDAPAQRPLARWGAGHTSRLTHVGLSSSSAGLCEADGLTRTRCGLRATARLGAHASGQRHHGGFRLRIVRAIKPSQLSPSTGATEPFLRFGAKRSGVQGYYLWLVGVLSWLQTSTPLATSPRSVLASAAVTVPVRA